MKPGLPLTISLFLPKNEAELVKLVESEHKPESFTPCQLALQSKECLVVGSRLYNLAENQSGEIAAMPSVALPPTL
jgi:hypothetical protein